MVVDVEDVSFDRAKTEENEQFDGDTRGLWRIWRVNVRHSGALRVVFQFRAHTFRTCPPSVLYS